MARVVGKWRALFFGLTRLLASPLTYPKGAFQKAPQLLALLPQGPGRQLLKALSRDAGLTLTLSDTVPGFAADGRMDVPPVIIYDRDLTPYDWRETVRLLARGSPRPYIILLSPNADSNLWDELQRVGGSDILRTPIDWESTSAALRRALQLWRNQQHIRSQLQRI